MEYWPSIWFKTGIFYVGASMKVASIQLGIADRAKEENIEHVLAMLGQVSDVDLVLLPEIWPSGYFSFDRYQAESEPADGPTAEIFRTKARERKCHILIGSFVQSIRRAQHDCRSAGPGGC